MVMRPIKVDCERGQGIVLTRDVRTRVNAVKDGRQIAGEFVDIVREVDIVIDVDMLFSGIGTRAVRAKSGCSTLHGGAIVAIVSK